jgi:hypothetical protein
MAMMQILIRMSIQGSIIVGIVLILRMVFRGLRISYRYCVLLWGIVFFYLIFPWKIENEHGFWRAQPESMVVAVSADGPTVVTGLETGIVPGQNATPEQNATTGQSTLSEQATGTDAMTVQCTNSEAGSNELPVTAAQSNGTAAAFFASATFLRVIFAVECLWLAGIPCFLAYFIFSYIRMKRRLAECLPGEEGVRYVDGIRTPMVFGILRPQIYLPVEMNPEFYDCVLQHERIHLRRLDYLWKILAYLISIVHWVNPVVWLAYYLLCCDMEKACDEAVTEQLEPEGRQEYATALLYMAVDTTARRIFAAPVCFDEGDIKGRIRHILKGRKTAGKLAALAVELCVVVALILLTQKGAVTEQEPEAGNAAGETADSVTAESDAEEEKDLPTFYIRRAEDLQISSPLRIVEQYITDRATAWNHYYIDADGVLWGSGYNQNGQLGNGSYETDLDLGKMDAARIADHVVSVDANLNNNFCIYLTDDGKLYGMGLNMAGLLLGKDSVKQVYSDDDNDRVCTPVLLMENVRYARAGREAIVALQEDGSVYWWGQMRTTTSTYGSDYDAYWTVEENPDNPVKMMYLEPHKVLENCVYVDISAWNGAAITENGDLYMWGLNIFGQCGVAKSENVHDFVWAPEKVLENVSMVWLEAIRQNDDGIDTELENLSWAVHSYTFDNFALLQDGTLLAAGENLGKDSVTTVVDGDLNQAGSHRASFGFVPVRAVVYSTEYNREILAEFTWGMSREDVRSLCTYAGLQFFLGGEDDGINIEDSRYRCYFDETGGLSALTIQTGSSRDERFTVDKTTLEEVQQIVTDAGGTLTLLTPAGDNPWEIWQYADTAQGTLYWFTVFQGKVTVITEKQLTAATFDGQQEYKSVLLMEN